MTRFSDLADLIQDVHIDSARRMEQEAIRTATGRAEDLLADALASALTDWIREFGSVHAPGQGPALDRILSVVQERIHDALLDLAPRARRAVLAALPEAVRLGADQARQTLEGLGQQAAGHIEASRELLEEAERISRPVAHYLELADRLLGLKPTAFPRLLAVLKTARRAVSHIQSAIGWLLNRGVNSGSTKVAEALGLGLLWVAEPDACVRCAAYSGTVAEHGQPFPGGLSYDPQQRQPDAAPIDGPPLHPHCRCRAIPWSEEWGDRMPALLQRQADRSVARGWSLPSESGPARVRAARDLLKSGRPLPPRVAARARRAVAEGRFARR
ncbi:hypothetical protein ACWGB8_01975 [Kitasatospora sp. NPDC054939]